MSFVFHRASAAVVEEDIHGETTAALPAHAVTTLYYIVGRYRDREAAEGVVDWLLRYFSVAPVGRDELLRARSLGWPDFEDAVVAAAAEAQACRAILTRNVKDFPGGPVAAVTPEEHLMDAG
ncbi:PIN domain-containing protein [Thiohalorhabdus sp.]|uniref:PIN domain-containing protein n=1 Tax=Thiohalorhabdus sp. TaxID=3094134 RepID=UPI002FC2C2EA